MEFGYTIAKSIIRLYKALFIRRVEVLGTKNILPTPKVIVSNHAYISDSFVLPFIFKEKLHFLIQESVFRVPLIGFLLSHADQLPVIPGRGRELLRKASQRLTQGDSIVIFPEGVLNHGKEILPAKGGAALLALTTGVPLQPLGIYAPPEFTLEIHTRHKRHPSVSRWQLGGPIFVNIGEPVYIGSRGERPSIDPHSLINQVMLRVEELAEELKARWNSL